MYWKESVGRRGLRKAPSRLSWRVSGITRRIHSVGPMSLFEIRLQAHTFICREPCSLISYIECDTRPENGETNVVSVERLEIPSSLQLQDRLWVSSSHKTDNRISSPECIGEADDTPPASTRIKMRYFYLHSSCHHGVVLTVLYFNKFAIRVSVTIVCYSYFSYQSQTWDI
jgi:hypothetical protein